MLRRWLEAITPKDPVILMGDLNADEDQPAVQLLVEPNARPRLFNAFRAMEGQRREGDATFHRFAGTTEGLPIDYIFHSGHFTANRSWIDRTNSGGKYPSDHYPLTAELAWQ